MLLAQSEEGYGNLMRLASRAYFDVPLGDAPRIAAPLLAAHAAGLIALTGGPSGPLDAALRLGGRRDLAEARLAALRDAFGDRLYVEIQRHGLDEERAIEAELIALADRHGLPLVAANEPFFGRSDDYEAHDALLAIAEGRLVGDENRRRLTPEHHFKTRAQMAELFRDLPDAVQATVEIAMRCAFRVRTAKPFLPRFSRSAEGDALDEAGELRRQAEEGLEQRLAAHGPAPGLTAAHYRERLAYEVDVISRMKYPGLLPHRRRLHQMGEGPRHPGRAGARLGRRLARRLRADRHRPRPLTLRPPVRALPQPGARVDAGFRHRFLRRRPRARDRVRAEPLR